MKNSLNTKTTILMAVLIVSLAISGILFIAKNNAQSKMDGEMEKNQELISTQMKLDKSVKDLKDELLALTNKNKELDKLVKENNQILLLKEQEIKKLVSEKKSVNNLKEKLVELDYLKKKIQQQVIELETLRQENVALEDMLKNTENNNNELVSNNTILKAIVADNYLIESTTKGKNNKPTVVARRTKKLSVSFDLPAEATKSIHFMLKTPSGEELSSKTDLSVSINITEAEPVLVASTNNIHVEGTQKRVEMVYKPKNKLKSGIYKFNIYNGGSYLGSTQVRLK